MARACLHPTRSRFPGNVVAVDRERGSGVRTGTRCGARSIAILAHDQTTEASPIGLPCSSVPFGLPPPVDPVPRRRDGRRCLVEREHESDRRRGAIVLAAVVLRGAEARPFADQFERDEAPQREVELDHSIEVQGVRVAMGEACRPTATLSIPGRRGVDWRAVSEPRGGEASIRLLHEHPVSSRSSTDRGLIRSTRVFGDLGRIHDEFAAQ